MGDQDLGDVALRAESQRDQLVAQWLREIGEGNHVRIGPYSVAAWISITPSVAQSVPAASG
jgi:hypothetical protein